MSFIGGGASGIWEERNGKADLAVFRPSNGTWFIFGSQSGIFSQAFGITGDKPTPNAYVY